MEVLRNMTLMVFASIPVILVLLLMRQIASKEREIRPFRELSDDQVNDIAQNDQSMIVRGIAKDEILMRGGKQCWRDL